MHPLKTKGDTLHVTSNITPQQMVQQVLIGGGVLTSNITYTGASVSRGKFWGGPGNVGIRDGIILTSGTVDNAPGPNNTSGKSYIANTAGDPDLTQIAGVPTYDACVLEFDFVPQSSLVSFRYVFASEEYHEYVFSYNDVFAFLISGPGITGPYSNNSKNIALLPLSSTPVSINTVNCGSDGNCFETCTNCQYFVNNNQNFTQYDAFTTVLQAWATVIPCETYHIKLAIADGSDGQLDSGVFLEAGSFTSLGISSGVEFTQGEFVDFAIEGCSDAEVTFNLTDMPEEDFWLPIYIEGSATNGIDYVEIPDSIFFPVGYTEATQDIITIPDANPEWIETIKIIYNSSVCSIDYDTLQINLWDYSPLYINTTPDTTINCATQATIGVTGLGGFEPYTYLWSTGETAPYITVSPLITTKYYVTVTALCDTVATDSITVSVNGPKANAGADKSIPYGSFTTLQGSVTQGSGDYTYSWTPAYLLDDPTSLTPTTLNMTSTTLFTLVVTDLAGGCQDMDQVVVLVTGGPLGVFPIAVPDSVCLGEMATIYPYAQGGTENYTFTWTSDPPGFSSDLDTIYVQPVDTTTYHVLVFDGYNYAENEVTVNVLELPLPEAGENDTIPFGTYTVLNGSGSQGTGYYNFFWEPIDSLVFNTGPQPVTKNLRGSTLFWLTLTDVETGCLSPNADYVTVTVTGGPLNVAASAQPGMICKGDSTRLFATAGGGNPYYEYHWTDQWGGIYPDTSTITVNPSVTTTYSVVVDDLFNLAQDEVKVTVSNPPPVNLGSDRFECPYDTITIDAGLPGENNYYWSNGSTEQAIQVGTTGIGFDVKKVWVTVENEFDCAASDTVYIYFDFANCFGIDEERLNSNVLVWPNPTTGTFTISLQGFNASAVIELTSLEGRRVFSESVQTLPDGSLEKSIDLSEVPEGIYILKVVGRDEVRVSRIIRN